MIKAVIDTNIIISAILFGGKPREVLNKAIHRQIESITSEALLSEIFETLMAKKFSFELAKALTVRQEMENFSTVIYPQIKIELVRDKNDNMVLECASAGAADYIITGDKDLLVLKQYRDIKICTAAVFLNEKSKYLG